MTNMKRSLSDSEDDLYDDDDLKNANGHSGHTSERKKRRGIIEKRRRDRINNSLTELRRLVPAAFEKQGSAKLEKAEILQMTVDHLKMLHSKGINGYNLDTAALAMDYRSVGFRECAAEVARYMVAVEGMDIQDPLRLRLLSHLQCYSAQREAAAKASLSNGFQGSSWAPMGSHHHSQYNSGAMGTMPTSSPASMVSAPPHGAAGDQLSSMTAAPHPSSTPASYPSSTDHRQQPQSQHHDNNNMASGGNMGRSQVNQPPSSTVLSGLQHAHQFPASYSSPGVPGGVPGMLSPGAHYSTSHMTSLSQHAAVKPYRPWGTELAY